MIKLNFKAARQLSRILSACALLALVSCKSGGDYPAEEGFNEKESDKKAIEIADHMMDKMGGYKAWKDARYIAWTFFGQYQIWDKKEGLLRHEKNNVISVMNLKKRDGIVFVNGARIQDTTEAFNKLSQTFAHFSMNRNFLALPYRLKEKGATIKYKGEGTTMEGRKADIIQLTFKDVDMTPDNMHELYIDKETGLPAQWAFYNSRSDKTPAFIRNWTDYKDFNGLKLATNRNAATDTLTISHITVTNHVPKSIFLTAKAIDKSLVK